MSEQECSESAWEQWKALYQSDQQQGMVTTPYYNIVSFLSLSLSLFFKFFLKSFTSHILTACGVCFFLHFFPLEVDANESSFSLFYDLHQAERKYTDNTQIQPRQASHC